MTTIILTLAGCASEDYVGNEELLRQNENGKAVSFSLVAAPQTRADQQTGSVAASTLNNNFVVYAQKVFESPASTQLVFNNYQVNYATNSANTTTSNSAGWEYVGYKNLPYGTTTASGVALNTNGVAANATASGVEQSIKYWDYSAHHYDFFAYSLGKGDKPEDLTSTQYAKASAMSSTSSSPTSYSYSLSGSEAQLKACYISNIKTIQPYGSTGTEVELEFRNFASKVKIAFYETVPGYSVKELKFYQDGGTSTSSGVKPYLYASSTNPLPIGGGTYNISFTNDGKAYVSAPTDPTTVNKLAFGSDLTYTAEEDYKEAEGPYYIGRSSNAATPTDAITVLPNPSGTDLHLKIDYTLLSRDGYGEVIHVTGATATVPAAYAQWQPNHSYTYLFKISDNTNGLTNPDLAAKIGLSPITLDAVVNVNADGKQETITTVTEPSITTYQKGSNVTGMDEYYAGNIYIIVGDGTTTLTSSNAKLYTATVEDGAAQGITETTVANALVNGVKDNNDNPTSWTVTDANDKDLVVTAVGTNATDKLFTEINNIPAADAPDGRAITGINGAKFSATADTSTKYYVFEYTYVDDITDPSNSVTKHLYKVIKVGPITTYQKGVTSTEEYQAGNIYFWVADGSTALILGTGANLYTVTNVAGSSAQAKPEKEISEASVADVLKETLTDGKYTKTDANGWIMTVTPVASSADDKLATFTTIPAADSSSGSADNSKEGVTFAAIAGKIYVLEYIVSSSEKYYKVIKVAPAS